MDPNMVIYIIYHTLCSIFLAIYTSLVCIIKQIIPYKHRCKSVRGDVALITGAGSGIGKLMAKKLANLGVELVLVDIDEKNNEKTAQEIIADGGNAKAFTCDLSKREEIYRVCSQVCCLILISFES